MAAESTSAGRRVLKARDTVRSLPYESTLTSVADTVNAPVSRFTEPGPTSVDSADARLRSKVTPTPLEPAPFENKARICRGPESGSAPASASLRVFAVFQLSLAKTPPEPANGQVTAAPPAAWVTSVAGTVVQVSASPRRHW